MSQPYLLHAVRCLPCACNIVSEEGHRACASRDRPCALPDQELLSVPDAEGALLGARARSASDAAVLRRKGHLKEQVSVG